MIGMWILQPGAITNISIADPVEWPVSLSMNVMAALMRSSPTVRRRSALVSQAGGAVILQHGSTWKIVSRSPAFQYASLTNLEFTPQAGAAGFQLSNPSVIDITAVVASLEIFNRATMEEIRKKSVNITGYLEHLLLKYPLDAAAESKPFTLITPSNPAERGAQLSIRLQPGLLDRVLHSLEEHGVVIDERKPDVVRVAPAPLYNTYTEVWEFCQIFLQACEEAVQAR